MGNRAMVIDVLSRARKVRLMVEFNHGRLLRLGLGSLQVMLLQLVFAGNLLACPTCKNGLHADGFAAAYAMSILFMMGMPFVILSCWVTTIVRLRKNIPEEADLDCDESGEDESIR
jgi:hypothetical protein